MSEEMQIYKAVIMCNHSDADSIMAALIMGAAAAATGDEVLMFFQPGAAKDAGQGRIGKAQRPARYARSDVPVRFHHNPGRPLDSM
jgi:predicted peroxiredoxin